MSDYRAYRDAAEDQETCRHGLTWGACAQCAGLCHSKTVPICWSLERYPPRNQSAPLWGPLCWPLVAPPPRSMFAQISSGNDLTLDIPDYQADCIRYTDNHTKLVSVALARRVARDKPSLISRPLLPVALSGDSLIFRLSWKYLDMSVPRGVSDNGAEDTTTGFNYLISSQHVLYPAFYGPTKVCLITPGCGRAYLATCGMFVWPNEDNTYVMHHPRSTNLGAIRSAMCWN